MYTRLVNSRLSTPLTRLYYKIVLFNQTQPHSTQDLFSHPNMDVKILPALQDNYMYLIVDKVTNNAAVVDPVEPQKVMDAVKALGAKLTTVLTTHHHWDHAGGNQDLLKLEPGLVVYGGDERIGGLSHKVFHNTNFNVGNLKVQCLYTPCHTSGHICYYVTVPDEGEGKSGAVFTGDTLFLGGCGRFFEGTAEQMYTALIDILSMLPDHTRVFCGHEYTLQNLKFANIVEPDNEQLKEKLEWTLNRRKENKPTVPSTIGEEKTYNPFMRVFQPSVMTYAKTVGPIDAMKVIRLHKDNFKG